MLYSPYDIKASEWLRDNPNDPNADTIRNKIATMPTALWVGSGDIGPWVGTHAANAQKQNQLPVFVAYDIPNRDLGQYSAGGQKDLQSYIAWSKAFAQGIGSLPAVLIVEPDSLIHMAGLSPADQNTRLLALTGLLANFAQYAPYTSCYLDGGDGRYNAPEAVAPWMTKLGVGLGTVRGFAVNVANYNPTAVAAAFAKQLTAKLVSQGAPPSLGYVIDISRNGNGTAPDAYIKAHAANWWCNWPGCKIGSPPSVSNTVGADALLWVKEPGVSDGTCGMAASTPSGTFDPALALRLISGK